MCLTVVVLLLVIDFVDVLPSRETVVDLRVVVLVAGSVKSPAKALLDSQPFPAFCETVTRHAELIGRFAITLKFPNFDTNPSPI